MELQLLSYMNDTLLFKASCICATSTFWLSTTIFFCSSLSSLRSSCSILRHWSFCLASSCKKFWAKEISKLCILLNLRCSQWWILRSGSPGMQCHGMQVPTLISRLLHGITYQITVILLCILYYFTLQERRPLYKHRIYQFNSSFYNAIDFMVLEYKVSQTVCG